METEVILGTEEQQELVRILLDTVRRMKNEAATPPFEPAMEERIDELEKENERLRAVIRILEDDIHELQQEADEYAAKASRLQQERDGWTKENIDKAAFKALPAATAENSGKHVWVDPPEAKEHQAASPEPKKKRAPNPDACRLSDAAIADIRTAYEGGKSIADLAALEWPRLSDNKLRKWAPFVIANACNVPKYGQGKAPIVEPTPAPKPVVASISTETLSNGESYPSAKALNKIKFYWESGREDQLAGIVPLETTDGTRTTYSWGEIQEIAEREGWTRNG